MTPEISIILPCRDEEQALDFCLNEIKQVVEKNNLSAEVIVSDSSFDKSPEIAKKHGAILVKHNKEGYGSAYLEGIKHADGKYIFIADADATYDFARIPEFIHELKNGNHLVLGNRFSGKMEAGAMPFLNRHIGNPILSFIFRVFFKAKIKDTQSGMRAFKKQTFESLGLKTTGMEFASEMLIKAIRNNLKIKEIPINYRKRMGKSKLKPYSDAWKHVRFMLLYSPLFLFLWPGLILFLLGASSMLWLYFDTPELFGIKLFYHPMFLSSLLLITGYQLIIFAGFAKIYSINHLGEKSKVFENLFQHITIERASLIGGMVIILGIITFILIALKWLDSGFGELNEIKNSVAGLTLIVLGIQTIFSSFMLSILGIKK